MKRYSSYRDSGIPWLGQIPEHWDLKRAKYIFSPRKVVVGERSSEYELLSLTLQGVIKRDMENPTGKFPTSFDSYQEVHEGDFVFCLFDNEETPRTVGLSKYNGMITGAYDVFECTNKDILPKYVLYYYLTIDNSKHMKPLYKGLRKTIPYDAFMRYRVPFPPLSEQEKIVAFIDIKTNQIDAFIAKREKQLKALLELRQAIIADAVTHGLNPNVPMKDSGVAWMSKIPAHWTTKRFAAICKQKSICNCENEELLSVYLDRGVIRFSEDDSRRTNPTSKDLSNYQLVEYGDFVLNNQQAWRGSVGVSKHRGIVSPAYFIFELSHDIDTDFANYLFRSRNYVAYYHICSKGVGSIQRNLVWGHLKQKMVFLPPIDEQRVIVEYIDSKCKQINDSIAQIETEITHLKEYKHRLIADAVTGAINVQE